MSSRSLKTVTQSNSTIVRAGSRGVRQDRSTVVGRICEAGEFDGWLEFNIPFQHKYGYIRDEGEFEAKNERLGSDDQ